jgi:hypothetical protein
MISLLPARLSRCIPIVIIADLGVGARKEAPTWRGKTFTGAVPRLERIAVWLILHYAMLTGVSPSVVRLMVSWL